MPPFYLYTVNIWYGKCNAMEKHDLIKTLGFSYSEMYLRLANPTMFTTDQLEVISNYFASVFPDYSPIDPIALLCEKEEK
jgi:hypothetical protein